MRRCALSTCLVFLGFCISAGQCDALGQVELRSNLSAHTTAMPVTVRGVVTYVDTGECYLESADRAGGIYVEGDTTGIVLGGIVEARGSYSSVGGEPAIVEALITSQSGSTSIQPFLMNSKSISGAPPPLCPGVWDYVCTKGPLGLECSWRIAGGANNTGLLVATCGTVRASYQSGTTGMRWFYLDDGAGVVSDYGDTGVLVYCSAEANEGDFVRATGISSVEPSFDDASRLIRVIRTRGPNDVVVERAVPVAERTLYDEFDSSILDPKWCVQADQASGGGFSLTRPDGWLTLVAPPAKSSDGYYHHSQLIQYAPGSWSIEMKVRLVREEGLGLQQGFGLALKHVGVTPPSLWSTLTPFISLAAFSYDSTGGAPVQQVNVAGEVFDVPPEHDTCWLRIRWLGEDGAYISYSTDGIDYSDEFVQTGKWYALFLTAYVWNTGEPASFAASIDYIRAFAPWGG